MRSLNEVKARAHAAAGGGSATPEAGYVRGMERLVDAVRDLAAARGLADVVEIVRHAARELVDADGATFVLREGALCHYVDEDAIAPLWRGQRFPLEACISGWAMLNATQVAIPDIYADGRIPHDAYRPTFVRSLAMTPIRTADPLGSIGTYWARQHQVTPAERKLLQALADSTAVALENVRCRSELEDRVAQRTTQLAAANADLERVAAGVAGDLVAPAEALAAAVREGAPADVAGAARVVAALAGELLARSRAAAGAGEAHQRQEWLQACIALTRELLAGAADPLRSIAHEARRITGADQAGVVLLTADEEALKVAVAVGEGADRIMGLTYPADATLAGEAIRTGRPLLVADVREHPQGRLLRELPDVAEIGPAMVVPLLAHGRARGALSFARLPGRRPFEVADLELAAAFANHAAIALEFADARAVRQEIALLEDRDKIAQNLYDEVIHRLFAAGLAIEGVAAGVDAAHGARLQGAVAAIDDTISQMRSAIYGLRAPVGPAPSTAEERFLGVVAEQEARLGSAPVVSFEGPVDAVVPARLVDEAAGVLREALAEIAAHGGAAAIAVALRVLADSDSLELTVADTGRPRELPRLGALANLRALAELRGGSLSVGLADSAAPAGCVLRWVAPIA